MANRRASVQRYARTFGKNISAMATCEMSEINEHTTVSIEMRAETHSATLLRVRTEDLDVLIDAIQEARRRLRTAYDTTLPHSAPRTR